MHEPADVRLAAPKDARYFLDEEERRHHSLGGRGGWGRMRVAHRTRHPTAPRTARADVAAFCRFLPDPLDKLSA